MKAIDVAIVGGGFSGAAVAYHLARLNPMASIAVFEPRSSIGGGLAYDDQDPAHRINVPASRMSLIPDDESHFARWIAETDAGAGDPDIAAPDGSLYPQRRVFGRYVSAFLQPLLGRGSVTHVRSRVMSVTAADGYGWVLSTDTGERYRARISVLATTHPAPDPPAALAALRGDRRLIADPLLPDALSAVGRDETVVIVGTGLTMADVVASLDRRGHRGRIVALSRRGLRSRGHATHPVEPYGDFTGPTSSVSILLRNVRAAIREAGARGLPWQSVIDAVRAQAQTFWPKLSRSAQSRIVRHLRVYWDVHRFRIAPQVEAVLAHRIAAATLEVFAASLVGASAEPDRIVLTIRRRGHSRREAIEAGRVVVTTGPAHSRVISAQTYLAELSSSGHVFADHLSLGLACDARNRALDAQGAAQAALFIAGPLARAQFGELMGLPQASAQALRVAEEVDLALAGSATRAREAVAAK